MYYNSQYNFCFDTEEGILLYNSNTGATIKINGESSRQLVNLLVGDKVILDEEMFEQDLLITLLSKGFIVETNRNELREIRERYWKAKGETPIVLTITTTMNCNLGCYYCYEERTKKRLDFKDISSIILYLETILENSPKKSLHVDWYGGEPLLNIEFMEQASLVLQSFCEQRDINYRASIISNGTVWPSNVEKFVQTHKIRQVQISFDGLKENHNARRRYRQEYMENENNSFDITFNLVEKLLNCVKVDVRFNIDWKNKADIFGFISLIKERGWFSKKYDAVFQPARISAYTERSAFMSKKQLSLDEFDDIRRKVSFELENVGSVEESEVPDGYPFPKTYVCAALATDSFIVGADQLVYRCGLQVGQPERAVGSLDKSSSNKYSDKDWWAQFDPTKIKSCSTCSFLPICFGGCPKRHLEGEQFFLDEQSEYWKKNLGSKVSKYLNYHLKDNIPLESNIQFRAGYN